LRQSVLERCFEGGALVQVVFGEKTAPGASWCVLWRALGAWKLAFWRPNVILASFGLAARSEPGGFLEISVIGLTDNNRKNIILTILLRLLLRESRHGHQS